MIGNEKKGISTVTARTPLRLRRARLLMALLPVLCLVCALDAALAQAAPSWNITMTHKNGWGIQGATSPNNGTVTSFDRGSGFNAYTITVTNASASEGAGGVAVGTLLGCTAGPTVATSTSAAATGFAYTWLRNGVTIGGATASSYTVAAADAGKQLQCRVLASNAEGMSAKASSPVAVAPALATVPPVPGTNTALLSGSGAVGTVLTCNTTGWTGSPTFTFQWLRSGNPIPAATANTYTVVSADRGTAVQCELTGTNAGGAAVADTAAPKVVPFPNPTATAGPTITPATTPAADTTVLTCNNGTWTGSPAFTYQWLRGGVPIVAQIANTYVVSAATDTNAPIQCQVTGTTADGSATAVSASVVGIANPSPVPPTLTTVGVVSGTKTVGKELTCAHGTWANTPSTYSYQWLRNGVPIAGSASGPTPASQASVIYTLVAADANKSVQCQITATNAGGSATSISTSVAAVAIPFLPAATASVPSSAVSVADQLPDGLYLAGTGSVQAAGVGWTCTPSAALTAVTCKRGDVLPPSASYPPIVLHVHVLQRAPDQVDNSATVSGGGAGSATVNDPTAITSNPFGMDHFTTSVTDSGGQPFTQAGGHPYAASSSFAVKMTTKDDGTLTNAGGDPKDIETDLPPGFIGNVQNVPECSLYDFATSAGEFASRCPASSAVGYAAINLDLIGLAQIVGGNVSYGPPQNVLLYNITPPTGTPAAFAFQVLGRPFALYGHLRRDGSFGVTVGDYATGKTRPIAANLTFCANGAASTTSCSPTPLSGWTGPLLTNPTKCDTPVTVLRASSYQEPNDYAVMDAYTGAPSAPQANSGQHTTSTPVASSTLTGCSALTTNWTSNPLYQPSISVQPDSHQAETPVGVEVDLSVPQTNSEGTLANTALDNSVVTLPEGVTLSPSAANGVTACSEAEMGLVSDSPIRFDLEAAGCADSAKVGTLTIKTPLLDEDLHGAVYLATQNANPFGSKFAIYLAVNDVRTGTVVKLAGRVSPDPVTGQLTTTFAENPQLPFDDLVLHFFGGSRAALVTPSLCGEYTTTTGLSPWSAADPANPTAAETATSGDSFKVDSGPHGSACPAGLGGRPFAPSLSAGTESAKAGAASPFVLRLTRNDGEQELSSLEVVTPKGFTASLKGVPYCSQAGIEAAEHKPSAAAELAQPSCPSASQVGTITTAAGAGETPFYVTGKAYLAGPYKGAPLSMVFITPALAGPFDFGNVAVRAALHVDPVSTQVTVKSDPIPRILEGVPLRVRSIKVAVDRPGFTRNPTSCDASTVRATVAGASGASSSPSSRFQVGDCSQLGFQPKLALSLFGPTHRHGYPRLRAVLTTRDGDANIGRAQVTLPKTEFLEQAHIRTVCTRVQYAAMACPQGSIYGYAKAWSPLLDQPLEGPVYLRSSDHQLPDLVASLDGQIHVDLIGRIDSINERIRNTFETLPDAPVSKFELTMRGGKKGLLVNNTEVCDKTPRASVRFDGQNGKIRDTNPVVAIQCPKKKAKHQSPKRANP